MYVETCSEWELSSVMIIAIGIILTVALCVAIVAIIKSYQYKQRYDFELSEDEREAKETKELDDTVRKGFPVHQDRGIAKSR